MLVDPLPAVWRFDAIGTVWRIDTPDPIPDAIRRSVTERIDRFDRDWSRFREDSLVTRISREPGRYRLPADAGPLLELYRELYVASGGRVSPLVGRTLESLGYDSGYRLTPAATRAPVPTWEDAISWDGEFLDTVAPVILDVGAAGKGYLVDLVSELLVTLGRPRHIVDAGGDLRSRGVPMRVALEHPADPTKAIGIVELSGAGDSAALCASASNRRAWGAGLHHVLDAVTGEPTADVIATWAIASTALVADGAATALFFDTDPGFARDHTVTTVRMFSDGRLESLPSLTQHMNGELFR